MACNLRADGLFDIEYHQETKKGLLVILMLMCMSPNIESILCLIFVSFDPSLSFYVCHLFLFIHLLA